MYSCTLSFKDDPRHFMNICNNLGLYVTSTIKLDSSIRGYKRVYKCSFCSNFQVVLMNCFVCFRYKMFSLADSSGRRTASVALRNCIYLIPLGFLAYDCESQISPSTNFLSVLALSSFFFLFFSWHSSHSQYKHFILSFSWFL